MTVYSFQLYYKHVRSIFCIIPEVEALLSELSADEVDAVLKDYCESVISKPGFKWKPPHPNEHFYKLIKKIGLGVEAGLRLKGRLTNFNKFGTKRYKGKSMYQFLGIPSNRRTTHCFVESWTFIVILILLSFS